MFLFLLLMTHNVLLHNITASYLIFLVILIVRSELVKLLSANFEFLHHVYQYR